MGLNLGRSLTDKRGGNAIHSWDLGLKGEVTESQREILLVIIHIRRKREWRTDNANDGRPVSLQQIQMFYKGEGLESDLAELVGKGYLVLRHPKIRTSVGLVPDTTSPKGYDISMGQMSYEVTRILTGDCLCPTIVPTDITHIGVVVRCGD